MRNATAGGVFARLRGWFPDRELIVRSENQVRVIKLSSRVQLAAISAIGLLALVWSATIGLAVLSEWNQQREARLLGAREAKVASVVNRVEAYRDDIGEVAGDLERRQQFIETMVESHIGDLPEMSASAADAGRADARGGAVHEISTVVPEATGLAEIERRQLAFVESLTRLAEARAREAEAAIRKIGLDPAAIARMASRSDAMGGPLEALSTGKGEPDVDARFERLGLTLARMSALERGLAGIPNVLPARMEMISSGFGFRRDPFTGDAAMHSGLDFRGPIGTPIHAAADGTVAFVGVKGGYGNIVEIRHGNGLSTRYAHMSRFHAKRGDKVRAGEIIGLIGNSGRSTGPHLHFEVRLHDRAINPRPILEQSARIATASRQQERQQRLALR